MKIALPAFLILGHSRVVHGALRFQIVLDLEQAALLPDGGKGFDPFQSFLGTRHAAVLELFELNKIVPDLLFFLRYLG